MEAAASAGRVALAAMLACAACSSQRDLELAQRVQGHWYVEYPADDGATYRIVGENAASGELSLRYRRYLDGKPGEDQYEAGTWSVVGGLYRTRTLSINGKRVPAYNAAYYETYEIVALDANAFVYRNTRDGVTYRARRVAAGHPLP